MRNWWWVCEDCEISSPLSGVWRVISNEAQKHNRDIHNDIDRAYIRSELVKDFT